MIVCCCTEEGREKPHKSCLVLVFRTVGDLCKCHTKSVLAKILLLVLCRQEGGHLLHESVGAGTVHAAGTTGPDDQGAVLLRAGRRLGKAL